MYIGESEGHETDRRRATVRLAGVEKRVLAVAQEYDLVSQNQPVL